MSKKKAGEIILNLVFASVALMAIVISSDYSSYTPTRLGAKTFPTFISILLIIFAISNIVKVIFKKDDLAGSIKAEKNDKFSHGTALEEFIYRYRIIVAIIFSFVYYYLLYFVGFIISTLIFIPVMLLILECRKLLTIIIVTAASTIFMVVSFQILLGVPLPIGIIFR